MNEALFRALEEERSIFRVFSSAGEVGPFEAFHSPRLEEIAHWNLVYPRSSQHPIPAHEELAELLTHYSKLGITGHLALEGAQYRDAAAEESEYFALLGQSSAVSKWNVDGLNHDENDLDHFCSVIQSCFHLSAETMAYFKSKMKKLQPRPGTKFFVVREGNRVLGCCSSFRTDGGADFIFNVATVPDAEGKGVAKSILAYTARLTGRPLYTYSHNSVMRDFILPELGFASLGTLFCVPLAKLAQK